MGVYELDAIAALTAQVATLTRQLGSMKVNAIQASPLSYEHSSDPHSTVSCQTTSPFETPQLEQANFISNFNRQQHNPYSNTYNPGWRNHPNFSWGNNQHNPKPSPGFQPSQEKKPSLEEIVTQLATTTNQLATRTNQFITKTEQTFQNHAASIRNLEA